MLEIHADGDEALQINASMMGDFFLECSSAIKLMGELLPKWGVF